MVLIGELFWKISFLALGPVAIIAGWNAWTGRWRSWAHPYSGKGLFPLSLPLLGVWMMVGPFIDPSNDGLALWQEVILFPLALVSAPVLPFLTITLFYTPKRFPAFLRPRWLPPGWRPPMFVDIRGVHIKARFGPALDPSSKEVAAHAAATLLDQPSSDHGRIAHWHAYYEEENPEIPYLNLGMEGMRWCEISAYPRLVTIAQEVHEDRLHEEHFMIPLQSGQVHTITFIPGERISWRSVRARAQFPRVMLETATEKHSLAFQPQLGRRIARDVAILELVLGVVAKR